MTTTLKIAGAVVLFTTATRLLRGTSLGNEIARRRDGVWAKVPGDLRRRLVWVSRYLRRNAARARFQILRSPRYVLRLARYAPSGVVFFAKHQFLFLKDQEGLVQLRGKGRGDPDYYADRDSHREEIRNRLLFAAVGYGLFAVVAAATWIVLPGVLRSSIGLPVVAGHSVLVVFAVAFVAVFFGLLGKPANAEITDTAEIPTNLRPVTKDFVRDALAAYRGVKVDPELLGTISIRPEEKGWAIAVDLPLGISANRLSGDKAGLVAAFGFPDGMIWPKPTPASEPGNRLFLTITYENVREIRTNASAVIRRGRASFFESFPFAVGPTGDVIEISFFEKNFAFSSIMGGGKTLSIVAAILGVAADPRVDFYIDDQKATADYLGLRPIAKSLNLGDGEDPASADAAVFETIKMLRYVRIDGARKLKRLRELGLKKNSDEAANDPILRPAVVVLDECQVLFRNVRYGAEALALCVEIMEKYRAAGIVLVFATQVPDNNSLPGAIMERVSSGWAGEQRGHVGTDATLGTGAWNSGVRPQFGVPGTGVLKIGGEFRTGRTIYYSDADIAEAVENAVRVRGGEVEPVTFPGEERSENVIALGPVSVEAEPPVDELLVAIGKVRLGGELNVWPGQIAERIADDFPGATAKNVRSVLRTYGLTPRQVWNYCYGGHVFQAGVRAGEACDAETCERHNKDGYSWADLEGLLVGAEGGRNVA